MVELEHCVFGLPAVVVFDLDGHLPWALGVPRESDLHLDPHDSHDFGV
jgi:hypothetical protein